MAILPALPALVISNDTTLSDLVECLTNLNTTAKRCPCVIGTDDRPTAWDRTHRRLDAVLDEIDSRT